MNKRIIYKTANGGVAVVIPAPDCGLTVEQIALKDVPHGVPFKIVDVSELPENVPQDAWTVDEADLTDGHGADYGVGSDNPFIMPEVQS